MFDVHTHILPGIDDGSKDPETSLRMMEMMKEQGVELVVATPHYYCLDFTPEQQQQRALDARGKLEAAWQEKYGSLADMPELRNGSEIYLAESLQNVKELKRLKFTGTDLMLFEMPFNGYREWIPNLLGLLAGRAKGRPVFAHINRYLGLYGMKNIALLEQVPEAIFQFNTECFDDRACVKFMISLLKQGRTVFFASDCHGVHRRPPDMGGKMPELEKRLGRKFSADYLNDLKRRQADLLGA